MINYNEYINELKKTKSEIDYDRMYSGIERKLARKPVMTIAGGLALLLIAFAAYFNLSLLRASNEETVMAYVFDQEEINESLLMTYVFGD